MKTNVAPTSIRSYDELKRGKLSNQEFAILYAMDDGRIYSRRELSQLTTLETSAVAGRVNKLVADGLIVSAGEMKCPVTRRTVEALKLPLKTRVGH